MRTTHLLMISLLAAAPALAAVPAAAPTPGTVGWVKMMVHGAVPDRGKQVVLLTCEGDQRVLPIWIGQSEADSINMRIAGRKPVRPLTHDLLDSTLAALGAKVERVEIDALVDGIFHGKLYVKDARGTTLRIDARPSDLIALAAGAGLPVMVAPSVIDRAGMTP